ncbi:DEAD/DEAH box helicase [Stenotrophomonas sp.]|uniref:DEAD/DEAH box helicase n=1 Tax=Stenotrophomonas sp. TaxID=69392 RepID=UPI00289658EE|nr:DEAD/DEAH box helicase [Stenotrophomonas sp.]
MTATYTQDDIRRWFDTWTLEKGANYRLAVSQLRLQNDQLTALVQGSARRPYHAWVDLRASTRTTRSKLVAECSCPVGQNCKHLAAVVTKGLQLADVPEEQPAPAAPQPPLPPSPRTELLQALSRWHARSAGPAGPAAPSGPARGLAYELSVFEHRLSVFIYRTKRGADGTVKREKLLNLVPDMFLTPAAYLGQDDVAVLSQVWLLMQHPDHRNRVDIAALMQQIVATGRAFVADADNPVPTHWGAARTATLGWRSLEHSTGVAVAPALQVDGGAKGVVLGRSGGYVDEQSGEVGPLRLDVTAEDAAAFLALPVVFPDEAALVGQTLQQINPALPHPIDGGAWETLESPPLVPVLRLHSTEYRPPWLRERDPSESRDFASAVFEYGEVTRHLGDPSVFVQDEHGQLRLLTRNPVEEQQRERELQAAGLYRDARPVVALPGNAAQFQPQSGDWARFVHEKVPQLLALGWRVEPDPDFRHSVEEVESITLDVHPDPKDSGWFELGLDIEVDGQTLPLAPLLQQVLNTDPRWSRGQASGIDDDELVLLPATGPRRLALRAGRLKPLIALLGDLFGPRRPRLRVAQHDYARLRTLHDSAGLQFKGNDAARAVAQRLLDGPAMVPAAVPNGLQATLRHYQLEGLSWLQHLRQNALGGVLADDMGLGKTLQTLAHILLEKEAGRLQQPVLVVVPTSLLGNWQSEAERFTPGLRVLVLHGSARADNFDLIAQHDLVLTTYALLWRDEDVLREHTWHLLVLDEAQQAKNPRSRAALTLRVLKADHRLCLTGTPLENHLGELWTQFDFLLPGLLGSEKVFNQQWRHPIERHGDTQRAQWLAQRMRPFMLRRRKDEVATELPPKTLITRSVVLEGTQRDLYETVRATMEEKVRQAVSEQGLARSHIVVLDALLKLRQVCCDPRLLPGRDANTTAASAKLDLLREMLPEMVEEGRRILLFSQFTGMLKLLVPLLDELGLAHVVLTGETRDRQTPVQRFMQGEVPIFLISLKAGGVGLNLTRADTVIHFDPWWNPAAENQATDRAHRIGQDQPVFVYKLIAAGSIEERIAEMQERKAALAETILDGGGATGPRFSDEDLQALLAPLPGAVARKKNG